MKRTYLLWFAVLAFLLSSCTREDLFTTSNQDHPGQKFKVKSIERITFEDMLHKLPAGTLRPVSGYPGLTAGRRKSLT